MKLCYATLQCEWLHKTYNYLYNIIIKSNGQLLIITMITGVLEIWTFSWSWDYLFSLGEIIKTLDFDGLIVNLLALLIPINAFMQYLSFVVDFVFKYLLAKCFYS